MANIINNATSCSSTTSSSGYGTSRVEDICLGSLTPSSSPYDKIIDMINGLDLQDDGIIMNRKIKSIEVDFCNIVRDENSLNESMDYINHKALSDGDTSLKFALLFSSRNFDSLAMNDTKVRSKMLTVLEKNFQSAEMLRIENKNRLYNSITLLGEYYHRVRLADNSPVRILGESLLCLLIREICEDNVIDVKLARLILSQITLNGDIMRLKHMADLTQLLFHVRRNLIEQPNLQSNVKALLLMTLDLYYSNFSNLGHQLEEMYTKYLVDESHNSSSKNNINNHNNNNNNNSNQETHEIENQSIMNSSFQNCGNENLGITVTNIVSKTPPTKTSEITSIEQHYENGSFNDSINTDNDLNDSETKKWSEIVCEESYLEHEFSNSNNQFNSSGENNISTSNQYCQQNIQQQEDNNEVNDENLSQQYKSLSPDITNSVKQNRDDYSKSQQQQPRWRAPHFNRGRSEHDDRSYINNSYNNYNHHRQNNRRLSGSFDDDHNSVRSEGGSIRLYSVNDRLKHLQDKNERERKKYHHNHHHHHENNRSGNFDRNNHRNRGGGNNSNYRTYNRPPRFMKKNNNQISSGGGNDLQWRSTCNSGMSSSYHEDNTYANGFDENSHSRSSSRARTLPRSQKNPIYNNKSGFNHDNNSRNNRNNNNNNNNNNNPRKQHQHQHQQQQNYHRSQQSRNYNRNQRYSSQSSLASETSNNTLERRHYRRNYIKDRNNWEDTHSLHGQPEESNWNSKDNNRELVLNARNTTKYMNYLSQK